MAAVHPANRESIRIEAVKHGDYEFSVLRFSATEALSQPFAISIDVVSEDLEQEVLVPRRPGMAGSGLEQEVLVPRRPRPQGWA